MNILKTLGFLQKNIEPYQKKLDEAYEQQYYLHLTENCTEELLLPMDNKKLEKLAKELEDYADRKPDAEKYVERIRKLIQLREEKEQAAVAVAQKEQAGLIAETEKIIRDMQRSTKEYYKPEVYVCGEKLLAEDAVHDKFKRYYAKDAERSVLGIYLLHGSKEQTPTLSVTNLNIYISGEVWQERFHKIPVEAVREIKNGMLKGITLTATTGEYDIYSVLPSAGRNNLADALMRIII